MTRSKFRFYNRLALVAFAGSAILTGCDPTLRATTENGIINLSTSFMTSLLQAVIQVFQETSTA